MKWKQVTRILLTLAFLFANMPEAMAGSEWRRKMMDSIHAARAAVAQFDKSRDLSRLQEAGEKLEGVELTSIVGHAEKQDIRLQVLRTWMEILARVDSLKDPDFDPNLAPLTRVSPPPKPGEPAYLPGIDPQRVRDPIQRAEYIRAIEENRKKAERSQLQGNVRALDTEVTEGASRFIKRYYTRAPVDRQELVHAMEKAGIGAQRQQAILVW